MKQEWNIKFENVGLVYPNGKEALKNINLEIKEGEMVAIIGLSGAGKTTLLKTINKLSNITTGEIRVGDWSEKLFDNHKEIKVTYLNLIETYNKAKKNNNVDKKDLKLLIGAIKKEIDFDITKMDHHEKNINKIMQEIREFQIEKKNIIKKLGEGTKFIKQVDNDISYKNKNINIIKQKISKIVEKNKIKNKIVKNLIGTKEPTELKNIYLKELKKTLKLHKNIYQKSKNNNFFYIVNKLKGKKAREYKSNIGMVFQRYNLIYKSSVLVNALSGRLSKMPLWRAIFGIWSKEDKQRAFEALASVNMLDATYSRAEDLSGGQMQRVALARTITQNARLFLADEPVGALDPIMAKSVMDSFLELNNTLKRTIIMNLHHVDLAITYADRIIGIQNGQIVFDGKSESVDLKVLKQIYGKELEGFDAHELKEIMRKRKAIKG